MGLMLHAGANIATIDEVNAVETPEPDGRWFPIPHTTLIDHSRTALQETGLKVTSEAHGLWKDGMRYFGVLELESEVSDYTTLVGLRNSHDKSFRASLACGSRVFVCDNMAFSGEIVVGRMHTTNIMDDLERLTLDAVGRLSEAKVHQEQRYETYKDKKLSDKIADHLIMQAFRAKIINVQRIAKVNKLWRDPEFEDFEPRNIWSLFNAFTSAMAGNVMGTVNATPGLHGMMDNHCGMKMLEAA